jgi:LPXTG-site transpeptidase (sortase) family protein
METRIQQRRQWLPLTMISVGTVLIASSLVLMGLVWTGRISNGYSGPGTVTGFGNVLSSATPADTPAVPPTAIAPLTTAPLARMTIPAVGIDAPVVVKGIDANGQMEAPDNAWDVVWYDFTSRPGEGSNAVFSGHVDYINVGPAVFWPLKDLKPGDRIQVRYEDNVTLEYAVTAVNTFDADTAPVDEIVGPTAKDSVTLITCAGTFNTQTRQYDKRLIVRGELTTS